MDAQEIFDKVATHLFKQGKPSITEHGMCVYRGPEAVSCAVGCLIPDEMYDPGIENLTVSNFFDDWLQAEHSRGATAKRIAAHLGKENRSLLTDLQNLHDGVSLGEFIHDAPASLFDRRKVIWGSTEVMRSALGQVAAKHHLNASVLDTLSFEGR